MFGKVRAWLDRMLDRMLEDLAGPDPLGCDLSGNDLW